MKGEDSSLDFFWIDEGLEAEAIAIFRGQTSKNVSFVDCTTMAIVRRENVEAIFSFDEIYRKNGLPLVSAKE